MEMDMRLGLELELCAIDSREFGGSRLCRCGEAVPMPYQDKGTVQDKTVPYSTVTRLGDRENTNPPKRFCTSIISHYIYSH